MIVMKFGGTSVGSGEMILKTANLVKKEKREKVVVVSAMSGVTNKLEAIAKKLSDMPVSTVEQEAGEFCNDLFEQHKEAAKKAISNDEILSKTTDEIINLLSQLKRVLVGVGYLEEATPKFKDNILSFGERLSALIVSGSLNSIGVKAKPLNGYEAGLVTDSNFGRARPIHKKTVSAMKEKLLPLLSEGITPVVTGFIAADANAVITTLGRGGSDYSASLIGRYIQAEEVQIWTDVDGILSTDPKIVPNAVLINEISYVEAMDLAYFGAKVIHSKMIEPAMVADIPVRVKNTFNPENEGTLILREEKQIEKIVKAVAISRDLVIINLDGIGMAETPGIAGKIFTALGEGNINIIMISGSSESNLSFVINKNDMVKAVELLEGFRDDGIRDIGLLENKAMITIVGSGMRGSKGIAGKIFGVAADNDVNIIMIAQGSSEVNISFVINGEDGDKVIRALHREFIG